MNYRQRDKLIEAAYKGNTLYIKNTGVSVFVSRYDSDAHGVNKPSDICHVNFISEPSVAALKLMLDYRIMKEDLVSKCEIVGSIRLKNLSLIPYETKGAKMLFNKSTKKEKK